MLKKLSLVSLVVILVGLAAGLGAIRGFGMALQSDPRVIGPVDNLVMKATYVLQRWDYMQHLPADFTARWGDRVATFDRENRKIGVFVGDGTNATPLFPLQLEQAGFTVVRFDAQRIDKIRECSLIIFPGGAYPVDFSEGVARAIREYVGDGGGFIGLCLGCVAARQIGLVTGDMPELQLTGLIGCRIDNGFFKGRPREVAFLHMNGRPLSGLDVSPLVWWGGHVMGGKKDYGKGRVFLFSSHPEGGKIEYGNRYVIVRGSTAGTLDILLDAVFHVARP